MSFGSSALIHSVSWIERLLTGQFAMSLAVIAVGVAGFLVLRGNVHLEAIFRLVLGCFILFGAPAVAFGLINAAQSIVAVKGVAGSAGGINTMRPHGDYDPYAGAAVPAH